MHHYRRSGSLLTLALSVFALIAAAPATAGEFHLDLSRSVPEAGSEVHMAHDLSLWFTQSPQEGSVSVRLVDGAGDLVESGDPARDPEDGTAFRVDLGGHLGAGAYTVHWRAMGDDGHVVRGEFSFSVMAH
jgi:methionine-rich copper-binding protein CopC